MEHSDETLKDVVTVETLGRVVQLAVKGKGEQGVDQHQQQAKEHDPQQGRAWGRSRLY